MSVFILSWLLVPVLLVGMSIGCGMLVSAAVARSPRPSMGLRPALVFPVGFSVVVLLTSLLTSFDATAELSGFLTLLAGLAGLVLGRAEIRSWGSRWRDALWPLSAAAIPAIAVAAPVVLTGKAGFSGYGKIVDLAHQLSFMQYLGEHGRAPLAVRNSSFEEIVDKLLDVGYPGGTQAVVAAVARVGSLDVAWAYQPVLAIVAATLGLALYLLLERAIPSRAPRALAAAVAAQPTILYAYTLAAGVKELSGAAALAVIAAVFARADHGRPGAMLLPGAVVVASAVSVFSLTIVPWMGTMLAVFLLFELGSGGRRLHPLRRWTALAGAALLFAAPAVVEAFKLATQLTGGGPTGLGNLAAPVPALSTAGIWLIADHRFPLDQYGHATLTAALAALALLMAALGFARAALARDRGLLALGVSGAIGLIVVLPRTGPWVDLKAFCMTAPAVLALAFAGVAGLPRRHLPGVKLAAAALIAGGVLAGNAMQYHSTTLAPYDRLAELRQLNERFAGQGPALLPDFDEYAEYMLRDADASGLVNPWRSITTLNRHAAEGMRFVRDTDEFDTRYLQEFRLIIRRRDPTASRPPSNWTRVAVTHDYEVWRRTGNPRMVAAHLPLDARPRERSRSFCQGLTRTVGRAGPGARVAYSEPTRAVQYRARRSVTPRNWTRRDGSDLHAAGPGRLRDRVELPSSGRYRVWLRGSVGRPVGVSVDGRRVGSLRWRESYPGQYELVGTMRLRAGEHRLEISRGGGSLLPGTGNDIAGTTSTIGPLSFDPAFQRPRVRTIPASEAGAACRSPRRMDWIEVLRPAPRG